MTMSDRPPWDQVAGILLAGGQSSRIGGGDKCLLLLHGKSLLAHAIERLKPQVHAMVLNANGDPVRFRQFGLPVIADHDDSRAGPLAGILAGMEWANEETPNMRCIVTIPTDTPFFPEDLVARFIEAQARREVPAIAASKTGEHPVFEIDFAIMDHDFGDKTERDNVLLEVRALMGAVMGSII